MGSIAEKFERARKTMERASLASTPQVEASCISRITSIFPQLIGVVDIQNDGWVLGEKEREKRAREKFYSLKDDPITAAEFALIFAGIQTDPEKAWKWNDHAKNVLPGLASWGGSGKYPDIEELLKELENLRLLITPGAKAAHEKYFSLVKDGDYLSAAEYAVNGAVAAEGEALRKMWIDRAIYCFPTLSTHAAKPDMARMQNVIYLTKIGILSFPTREGETMQAQGENSQPEEEKITVDTLINDAIGLIGELEDNAKSDLEWVGIALTKAVVALVLQQKQRNY